MRELSYADEGFLQELRDNLDEGVAITARKILARPGVRNWVKKATRSAHRQRIGHTTLGPAIKNAKHAHFYRMELALAILQHDSLMKRPDTPRLEHGAQCVLLSGLMMDFPLFFWKEGVAGLAINTPVPSHRVDVRSFPFTEGMFLFQNDLAIEGHPQFTRLNSVMWWTVGDRVDVREIVADDKGSIGIVGYYIDHGQETAGIYENAVNFISAMSFLNTKLVKVQRETLPKPKSSRETDEEAVDNFISVVLLRDFDKQGEHHSSSDDGEIERDFQWWVRGHWRAQWYPSTKAHRLIWISPYLKGPEDKPLKPTLRAVVR